MKIWKRSAYFPNDREWVEVSLNYIFDPAYLANSAYIVHTEKEKDLVEGYSFVYGVSPTVIVEPDMSRASDPELSQLFVQIRIEIDHETTSENLGATQH